MNILYEENGTFKVGSVMTESDSSLQIESQSGKRSKIKSNCVLIQFKQPELEQFLPQAEALAQQIDASLLWEFCPQEELDFGKIAEEYYGQKPSALEAAAVLLCLHHAPIYFHKKGKGRFRAAPPDILQAAIAGAERKRQQQELQARYTEQLCRFELPNEFASQLTNLLYKPDRNTIEVKALEAACAETQLSALQLLNRCGAIRSSHDHHLQQFLFEHFPQGINFPKIQVAELPELATANVSAFSIDDATTTEIDDAFSVEQLANGNWSIGVHIAAPALGLLRDSEGDRVAAQRLSTVYMPGNKITMLPDSVVEVFTLSADRVAPALSMYIEVHPETLAIIGHHSRVEKVHIADNLRHDTLEPLFNEQTLAEGKLDYPYARELTLLWQFANQLEIRRGKAGENNQQQFDFNFYVEDEVVTISRRQRGAPIDKVVSELMILVNSEWGKLLADHQIAGIYRCQQNGKVRMSTVAAPHQGLGVAQYMWSSSPLRRYVDLVNQRQLISLLNQQEAAYARNDTMLYAAIRDFETAYGVYNNFQRNMERYWCLRWLQQEQKTQVEATVFKENLVRLHEIPLVLRVPSLPELASGTVVVLEVGNMELLELEVEMRYIAAMEEEATC